MTNHAHDAACDRLEEYALDLLPPDEAARIEAHVATCPECRAGLSELRAVMEGLAAATEPEQPRPELKGRVLAALEAMPRARSPRRLGAGSIPGRPLRWLAAAAVLALVVAGQMYRADVRDRRAAAELADARADVESLQRRLGDLGVQADLVISILTASDMRPIVLTPPAPGAAATARAYWSATQGLLVVADDLPVPPAGRVFQVWLIGGTGAKPMSAGLLSGAQSRRGLLIVPPPGQVSGTGVTVAITDEPAGGLPAPSGEMRLLGSL